MKPHEQYLDALERLGLVADMPQSDTPEARRVRSTLGISKRVAGRLVAGHQLPSRTLWLLIQALLKNQRRRK